MAFIFIHKMITMFIALIIGTNFQSVENQVYSCAKTLIKTISDIERNKQILLESIAKDMIEREEVV